MTTIPTMAAGGLTAFDATLVSTSIVLVFSLLVVLCLIIMLLEVGGQAVLGRQTK